MKRKFFLTAFVALALALVFVAASPAAPQPAKVSGTWELTWQGRQGTVTPTLTLKQKGEKLTGTFVMVKGKEKPVSGTIKGKDISFTVELETVSGTHDVTFTGTVDAATMKGTVPFAQGTREWTAKKLK